MTPTQTLFARGSLGVVVGIISIATLSSTRLRALSRETFDRLVIGALIVSRLAAYIGAFFIARLEPRGDVAGAYWPDANQVLMGFLPYRDIHNSYAPLHPYLDGLLIRLWHSPLALILFAICIEWLLLPVWLKAGRNFFTELELRNGALLYLTCAISFQFVSIDGQDNVIVACLLACAVLLLYRRRNLASGAAIGVSVACFKFLPLLYVPSYLSVASRPWRWILGCALPIGIVYGTCTALHLPIFSTLGIEGTTRTANNLPYLIEAVGGITMSSSFWNATTLAMIAIAIVVMFNAIRKTTSESGRFRILTLAMATLTLVVVIFSKKSWPPYLMLALFPICLVVPRENKLKTTAFAVFGVVALVAPSYWSSIQKEFSAQQFHHGLVTHQTSSFILLLIQTLLILGYAWLLSESIRLIIATPGAVSGAHARVDNLGGIVRRQPLPSPLQEVHEHCLPCI